MIRQSPLTYAGRVRTPTLFIHGEVDQRVPYEEGEQMYFALKRRGVPAKMIQYAGQPHGIARPLEQRSPDAQRAGVVGQIPEERSTANDQLPTAKLRGIVRRWCMPQRSKSPPPFGSWELEVGR